MFKDQKAQPKLKRFVIKKYVMALSASQALQKEKKVRADDCWVDEEWMKNNPDAVGIPIGYKLK